AIPAIALLVTTAAPATDLESLEGFVPASRIAPEIFLMVGKNRRGDAAAAVAVQQARGGTETGLVPEFVDGGDCPQIDSEQWAIDKG
ncbi:unnamed protein product, partial [Discosporangium mesarthrocarpum]